MEESKVLTLWEQIRWILSALFFLYGALYCSIGFSLAGIAVSAGFIWLGNQDDWDIQESLYSDIFLCNGITIASLGLTGRYWPGVAVVLVYVLLHQCICRGKKGLLWFNFALAAFFSLFIFPMSSEDCHHFRKSQYSTVKEKYENYQKRIRYLQNVTNEERECLQNPYKAFLVDDVLASSMHRQTRELENLTQKTDSLSALLTAKKQTDFQKVREQYSGKVETLRVKRFWMNSASLPWTWQAYTRIRMNNSSYGKLFGSMESSLEINGKGTYVGESRFDYVNVVFSDNSYQRFSLNDNPEWMLIRNQDKVERHYSEKVPPEGEYLLNALDQKDFDLVFDKKFVPLLKK